MRAMSPPPLEEPAGKQSPQWTGICQLEQKDEMNIREKIKVRDGAAERV